MHVETIVELELDMLELVVTVEKMLELKLLDAMLVLELLDVVPLPNRSAVVALVLEVVEVELDARLTKLAVDDMLLGRFGLVLCNDVVLLMMVKNEPAVEELWISAEAILPSVFEVVDKLELDCILEVTLDGPLLDQVDGAETPVGVFHSQCWRMCSTTRCRRPFDVRARISHSV